MSPVDFLFQSTPVNDVIYGFAPHRCNVARNYERMIKKVFRISVSLNFINCVARATHATPAFHLKLPVVGLFLLGVQPGVEDVVFNAVEEQETPGYGSCLGHQRATDMIEISRNKMK